MLENAEPAALIVDPSFLPVIDELRAALPFVHSFVALDEAADGYERYEDAGGVRFAAAIRRGGIA